MAVTKKQLDNLQPAKPGDVRNPKGRGKGIPNAKTRYKRFLELVENIENPVTGSVEAMTVMEVLDLKIIAKARKGDTKAYEIILDRLEGKPTQTVDMNVGTQETTEQKLKEFLDDTYDSAYDDQRGQLAAANSAESRGEVAGSPTDIS